MFVGGCGSSDVVVVIIVLIEDSLYTGGSLSRKPSGGGTTLVMPIPSSHSHNVIVVLVVIPSAFGCASCVPTTIMPSSSARMPVEFVSNTAIVSPFPWKVTLV